MKHLKLTKLVALVIQVLDTLAVVIVDALIVVAVDLFSWDHEK